MADRGSVALAQGMRDGARRAERIRLGELGGWDEWEDLALGRCNPTSDYELGFMLGADQRMEAMSGSGTSRSCGPRSANASER